MTATALNFTGAELLDDVRQFVTRFCVLPLPEAFDAVALWAAHAHVLDAFESTPRLAFLSPEPGSGKTRALEVLELLVPHPMLAVSATPAALFRKVAEADRPTILFDEIDTVFGPKAKDNEELRGMLNAGHRRSGVSYRCAGEGANQTVVAFPAFAAVAMGGLGSLPDTILTRSVIIRMRRRAPHETVEPFRARLHNADGKRLGRRLKAWTASVERELIDSWPEMPEGINDRPADVWEPLLAIADAAGGHWPDRARTACLALAKEATQRAASLGILLLTDLAKVFDGAKAMGTDEILFRLNGLDESPWATLKAGPLDSRGLSKFLGEYDIAPAKVRGSDGRSVRGYRAEDLSDAWTRYLPGAASPENPERAEQPEPTRSQPLFAVPAVA